MVASQSPSRPSGQSRRQHIIDVAVRMFSVTEYEDVSVDELCRQAGVAKGLVFYHFGDKRGLFAAAAERAWNEFAAFAQPRPDEDTVTDRMHGVLRRQFEYVKKHPQRFSILMTTGHSNPDVRDIVLRAREQAMSGVTASLGCPVNPPPRLRQALVAWIHFVAGVALDWIARRDTTIDDMCDLCIQALVAAVRSANGQPLDIDAEFEALAQVMNQPAPPERTAKTSRRSGPAGRTASTS